MKLKEWSEWMNLKENLKNIPRLPGVYKVRVSRSIPRFLGIDQEGVLLIGRSSNLRRRIAQFWKAINGISSQHSEGNTFYDLELEKIFPVEELEFRFKVTKNKEEAEIEESKLLNDYEEKFGELPPLNRRSEHKGFSLIIEKDGDIILFKKGNSFNDFRDIIEINQIRKENLKASNGIEKEYGIRIVIEKGKKDLILLDTDKKEELESRLKEPLSELIKKRDRKFEIWKKYLNNFK